MDHVHGPVAQQPEEYRAYVVGFMFSERLQTVLLIRKTKPAWQAGMLNGVGGKIESGELPIDAMIREFEEETGLRYRSWLQFHRERFRNGMVVHFFAAASLEIDKARSTTEEEIAIVSADRLPSIVIYNLHYLVPMARTLILESVDNLPLLDAA
jgi:8-oxo-dGTP diphosphatase